MNKLPQYLFTIALWAVGMTNLIAQNKQDYYWPLGYTTTLDPEFPGLEFNFRDKPFEPGIRNGDLVFDQMNASVCDKDGKLLFYTNGCAVANRNHEIMPNGEDINVGSFFNDFWGGDCIRGYPGPQEITILKDPNFNKGYYIIHKPTTYNAGQTIGRFSIDSIHYSYVDMNLDNGMGDVTEKNVNFFQDSILSSYLTPISQPNNQDWWIMNPVFPSGYVVFSLTENGLELFHRLDGPTWDERKSSSAGHARFSPDGTRYAYFNQFDGLYLYDFDRSDATLNNEEHIPWRRPEEGIFSTCEWSPNSRFLYLAKWDTLWQLDTHAIPLESGLEVIASRINGADPPTAQFGIAALGPDCRIYIRSKGSSTRMNVIHKPNEKGAACDFVQNSLVLPTRTNVGSFPNFPRFRVDEEEKCDPSITSIAGETVWWRRDLSVYPSPASEYVTVELPEGKQGQIYILDMQGQMVYNQAKVLYDERIDISDLASGIYSVEFIPKQNKERVVYTKRITVVE